MSRNHHRGRSPNRSSLGRGDFALPAEQASDRAGFLRGSAAAAASGPASRRARRARRPDRPARLALACLGELLLELLRRPGPASLPAAASARRAVAASTRTRRASSRSGASTGSRRRELDVVEKRDQLLRVARARRGPARARGSPGPSPGRRRRGRAARRSKSVALTSARPEKPSRLEQPVALRRHPAVAALVAVDVCGAARGHRLQDREPAADTRSASRRPSLSPRRRKRAAAARR